MNYPNSVARQCQRLRCYRASWPTRRLRRRGPKNTSPAGGLLDHRHTAARLIGHHRVLAAAKPHFRTAMIKRLTAALEQGLAPGHADRALALVAEDSLLDAECLIVKQALQQAWIAQRVGMCADCGDRDRHSPGCPQFDFSWDDTAAGGDEPAQAASRHR